MHDCANAFQLCVENEVHYPRHRVRVVVQDAGRELRPEGVPDAVFGFGGDGRDVAVGWGIAGGGRGGFDGDTFLAVHCFAGGQVLGDEEIFFAARDEDAGMSMWLLYAIRSDIEGMGRYGWDTTHDDHSLATLCARLAASRTASATPGRTS